MCSINGQFHGRFKKPVTITPTSISGADLVTLGRTIVLNFVNSGATCWGDVSPSLITCVLPMAQKQQVID